MRNTKAVWALVTALLALAALGGAVYAARYYNEVRLIDAVIAVPLAFGFSLAALIEPSHALSPGYRPFRSSSSPSHNSGTITTSAALISSIATAGS